ncbi:MAG TPA: glucosamine-6-phosphate deaminase [Cyclobacteriaceae bacterium]|nr:glucosamine-6-phosphate deaminase [Cyclobacteriaceae bacterium]
MTVHSYKTYNELSRATADLITETIHKKPAALICIASGHTPVGVFHCLREDIQGGKLDVSKVTFVSLDEWLNIDPSDPGSCISMLRKDFFDHVPLRAEQIQMFDVLAKDPQTECGRMNDLIAKNSGLDVMLVGVGLNGHIGMNEPGTSFNTYAHVADLAEATETSGQKYFAKPTTLSTGITLGLRHFTECRLPILMANGSKKAEIIGRTMKSKPTEGLPATIVHNIPQALVMIDAEASAFLNT